MGQTTDRKHMGLPGMRWFRRLRRDASAEPRVYPRIALPEENAPATDSPPDFELFTFDAPAPAAWQEARVAEIVATAPVGTEGVLNLAIQAAWPSEHPVARALTAAWRERAGDLEPQRNGIWHLSAGRGIQGYFNGYHILIGNEQLMRDGGITLPDGVREQVAGYEERGWRAMLVGARTSTGDRDDVHRSLIGLIAVAPVAPLAEPVPGPTPAPVEERHAPSALPDIHPRWRIHPLRWLMSGSAPAKARRLLAFGITAGAILILATRSIFILQATQLGWLSGSGNPADAAIVEPGLHLKWPWEDLRRFSRQVQRREFDLSRQRTRDGVPVVLTVRACWQLTPAGLACRAGLGPDDAAIADRLEVSLAEQFGAEVARHALDELVAGASDLEGPPALSELAQSVQTRCRPSIRQRYGYDLLEVTVSRLMVPGTAGRTTAHLLAR